MKFSFFRLTCFNHLRYILNPFYSYILKILFVHCYNYSSTESSIDRIVNEAILQEAIKITTGSLGVVLRCRDHLPHRTPLSDLNAFVGETYSFCWDLVLEKVIEQGALDDNGNIALLDVIVYAQSLPNAAPEQWLYHRPNLQCICGTDHDWWHSVTFGSSAKPFIEKPGAGKGDLQAHCDAVNADRLDRGLKMVEPLVVSLPQAGKPHPDVMFLEDDYSQPASCQIKSESIENLLEKVNNYLHLFFMIYDFFFGTEEAQFKCHIKSSRMKAWVS